MSHPKRDYYQVLEISRTADADEIKKAYRQRAMKFHPDRNPGDKKSEESFKEATEAYQVLSDAQKRQAYDQHGHAAFDQNGGGAGFGAGFGDMFEDIFEDFFGGGGRGKGQRPQRGADLQHELDVTFEEAAFGVEKKVTIRREEACGTCTGTGAKPGTSRQTCSTCRGQGQVLASSGFFSVTRPCPRCHGQGSLAENPCTPCHGTGRAVGERVLQIKVPAGIATGQRMRMTGEGEAGQRGGQRGDLYIDISVEPHEFFTREGDDLLCDVPISFAQAALGAEIKVPTLQAAASLKIPAGTQNGKEFRLKGKGLASLRGAGLGDEVIRVHVETPTHLSDRQKELLKEFQKLSADKVNPISASFGEKLGKFFKKK